MRYLTTILTMMFWLSACSEPSPPPKSSGPVINKVGESAPPFELPDLNGKLHTLKQYRGKPVIVNFWASWCPPCLEELPSMNRAWNTLQHEGIEMIALNVSEKPEAVTEFLQEQPINFTVLLDQQAKLMTGWGVAALPTTVVVDANGVIAFQEVGKREWDEAKLMDKVRALKSRRSGDIPLTQQKSD